MKVTDGFMVVSQQVNMETDHQQLLIPDYVIVTHDVVLAISSRVNCVPCFSSHCSSPVQCHFFG